MIYIARLLSVNENRLEYDIILRIDGFKIKCEADYNNDIVFVEKTHCMVDLWMIYGEAKKIIYQEHDFLYKEEFTNNFSLIKGKVSNIKNKKSFTLESFLNIDIELENEADIISGDIMEIKGVFKIYPLK
jgi:hypothetical protein